MSELQLVKAQLVHKSQLLDKVKILLQRAAAKEKMLHDKVRSDCQERDNPPVHLHFFFPLAQQSTVGKGRLILEVSSAHSMAHLSG